jgi:hypothetical protein
VLSVAQLRALAVLHLASQAPRGPPCSRLQNFREFMFYCSQWAEDVFQQSLPREFQAPCWTIRLETSCWRFWRWRRGKLYDRVCALVFFELCVEAAAETQNVALHKRCGPSITTDADDAHTAQYASERFHCTIELAGEEFDAEVLDAQACRHFTNNNFDITGLYMVPA